jgi:beta-phosphoglucomutase-like phosphatase (HAD superfamily)
VALLCERELRALIFDMDGTLFDSASVVPDAYIETVLACGGRRRHQRA